MNRPLWTPSPERIRQAAITAFRCAAAAETGLELPDYDALHAWSVADPAAFWRFYADDARLPSTQECQMKHQARRQHKARCRTLPARTRTSQSTC